MVPTPGRLQNGGWKMSPVKAQDHEPPVPPCLHLQMRSLAVPSSGAVSVGTVCRAEQGHQGGAER